jgi:hypothetical protein
MEDEAETFSTILEPDHCCPLASRCGTLFVCAKVLVVWDWLPHNRRIAFLASILSASVDST